MSILNQFETFAINTETAQSTEGGCRRRRRRRSYSSCYSYSRYSCYNPCGTTTTATEAPKEEIAPAPVVEAPAPIAPAPISEAPTSVAGCLNPDNCAETGIE